MSELQQLRDENTQLNTALTIKNGTIEQLKARVAELEAQQADLAEAELVAVVEQKEPYEDGTPNDGKLVRWVGLNAEDDLEVGTKIYAHPPIPQFEKTTLLKDSNVTYSTFTQQLERDAFNLAYSCAVENGWKSTKDLARYVWEQAIASCIRPQQPPAPSEADILGVERYRVEPNNAGFWPFCVKAGDGERKLYVGHKNKCLSVAAELATAFEDGKFCGSTAQQAPARQVPDGWRELMRRASDVLGSQGFEAWNSLASEIDAMLAAAPQAEQPGGDS